MEQQDETDEQLIHQATSFRRESVKAFSAWMKTVEDPGIYYCEIRCFPPAIIRLFKDASGQVCYFVEHCNKYMENPTDTIGYHNLGYE